MPESPQPVVHPLRPADVDQDLKGGNKEEGIIDEVSPKMGENPNTKDETNGGQDNQAPADNQDPADPVEEEIDALLAADSGSCF